MQSSYSTEEAAHHRYVHENTKKRALYKLNMAEPHQYGYVTSMLKRGGATPAKDPNLFRRLELARQSTGVPGPPKEFVDSSCTVGQLCLTPANLLEYATVDSTGRNLVSSLLSSTPGGSQNTSMNMNYRVGSNTPFAVSPNYVQYAGGTNFTATFQAVLPAGTPATSVIASALFTITTGATSATSNVATGGTNYYSYSDDDSPVQATSVCSTAPNYLIAQPPSAPCPAAGSACVNSGSITTNIIACYNRGGNDCNYTATPGANQFPLTI